MLKKKIIILVESWVESKEQWAKSNEQQEK